MNLRQPALVGTLLGVALAATACGGQQAGQAAPASSSAAPAETATQTPAGSPTDTATDVPTDTPTDSGLDDSLSSGSPSSGSPSSGSPSSGSPSASEPASESAPPSADDGGTGSGSKLSIGQSAAVRYVSLNDKTTLQVTAVSVERGSLSDFEGFKLDATTKASTPYYVTMKYRHAGGSSLRYPYLNVKLDASDAQGDEVQKIIISGLSACPSGEKAAVFKRGDTQTECSVFVVPRGGRLAEVQYRPDFNASPVTWKVP